MGNINKVLQEKNTIRDGGSTVLLTVHIVDHLDMVYTVDAVDAADTAYTYMFGVGWGAMRKMCD